MIHHRFANATQALFCQSCQWKLENMKNVPNNAHVPTLQMIVYSFLGDVSETEIHRQNVLYSIAVYERSHCDIT